jgi:Protein of unknown function (DUF1559)
LAFVIRIYEEQKGHLPPAAVTDKDGKPLLSWRVAILPYIEHADLYNQFHLDEPWDSAHNLTLLDQMPITYRVRSRHVNPPANMTYYQVLVGKGTPFETGRTVTFKDFRRGASNTILFVEAVNPVPWTKPEDIPYDPDGPLPPIGGVWPDLMRVGMADGHRNMIRKPFNDAELRAMITLD